MRFKTLITCLSLGLCACSAVKLPVSNSAVVSASTTEDWSPFTLGPNDRVFFAVLGQVELTMPETGLRVSPDGTLSLPLVGAIKVAGLSVEEARKAIEAGFGAYYHEPAVILSVMELASRRFYVFGEVKKPGPYSMDRPITALEALSFGGGFNAGANRDQVVVLRRHGGDGIEVIPFDASTPGPDGLLQINPNDLVFVSRSGVGVFSERVSPYLQGLGYSISQVAALALAYDRLYNDD